jgi:hypothetical protein
MAIFDSDEEQYERYEANKTGGRSQSSGNNKPIDEKKKRRRWET